MPATDYFVPGVTLETSRSVKSGLAITGIPCVINNIGTELEPDEYSKASGEQDRSNGIFGAVITSQRESRTNIQVDSRIS